MPHIFISYAKADTHALALALAKILNAPPHVTVWVDENLQVLDAAWTRQIQKEIKKCDFAVVLLSPDVNRPDDHKNGESFVLKEIRYAQQAGKQIVLVMAQFTEMPIELIGTQYIDFVGRRHDEIGWLCDRISVEIGIKSPIQWRNDLLTQAQEKLIGLLAHELRTPLTLIAGSFNLMEEMIAAKDDQPLDLENLRSVSYFVQKGIKSLSRLTEQTLWYADVISGHLQRNFDEWHNLNEIETLLKEAIQTVQSNLADKNIRLEIEFTLSSHARILALPSVLIKAISEILHNAVTFSQDDQSINVTLLQDGNAAVIIIQDYGCGIAAADIKHIFQPLFQSDRIHQEQQGIGLGLAIAQKTVQIHGGDIELESEWRKGTKVTIRLPIVE